MQIQVLNDELKTDHTIKCFISSADIEAMITERVKASYDGYQKTAYYEKTVNGGFSGIFIALERNDLTISKPSTKEIL